MMENNDNSDDKVKAVPYLDIKNPFGVGEDGAKAEYLLKNPEKMEDLAVGAKTLIRDERGGEDLWISAQVKSLEKYAPFHPERQKKLYLEGEELDPTTLFTETKGPHSHQPMIIGLDLEQELVKNSPDGEEIKYERSAVQRPPSIESEMVFPDLKREQGEKEPALEDMLQIQSKGIPLGAVGFGNKPLTRDDEHLLYRWDLEDLDIKHTFVVGESGSGKTVLLKRMAQQIRQKQDSSVIMTDVQGDLIQLALSRVIEKHDREDDWQKQILEKEEIPNREEAIESMKPFKIVVPRNSRDRSANVQALKTVCEDISYVEYEEIGLRLQDIDDIRNYQYLFTTSSDYAPQIINDAIEALKDSESADVTIKEVEKYLKRRKNEAESADEEDDARIYKTKYNVKSVQATISGALRDLKKYFDNHKPSLDEREEPPMNELKDEGTVILYLEELGKLEKVMYEMHTIRWLYENRDDNDENWEPYTFIDEAHQVIPERSSINGADDTFERLKLTFEKLAREGRKYDKHLILSTQSPQDIANVVNDQCHTRIVMKLNEKNARAAELEEKELRNIADSFTQGQFFIKSPFNDTSSWLRLHSWLPELPHADINPFWDKMKEEARDIST